MASVPFRIMPSDTARMQTHAPDELKNTAAIMVEKWKEDVWLTNDQQSRLMEETLEYLTKRQHIKTGVHDIESFSGQQIDSLSEMSRRYKEAVESILTEEQKRRHREIRAERDAAVTGMMQKIK